MTDQTQNQEVEVLFKLGAHLGHKKNRLHPKAKKNLYSMIDGVSIIDLPKTVTQLNKARTVLNDIAKDGKVALFVGTKKVASLYMNEKCKSKDVPFITAKWLPGLLTNFDTIIKNVKKLRDMNEQKTNGAWDQFVKHERTKMSKELSRLDRLYGGMVNLTKRPDILVIIDTKKEKNAVNEAKMMNIPVVALVDTNSNPEEVMYPVVANDDAPPVVEYITQTLLDAYLKGQGNAKVKEEKTEKKEVTVEEMKTEKAEKKTKKA